MQFFGFLQAGEYAKTATTAYFYALAVSFIMKLSKKELREKDKLWADAVKLRDNHQCQICHKKEGRLNVHHILPKQYKELRTDIQNGIVLCVHHHTLGKESAHKNCLWFADWLKINRPDLHIHAWVNLRKDLNNQKRYE